MEEGVITSSQTSGLAILKMMGVPDMAFRARKLNAIMPERAHKANLNTRLGSVYRFATDGPGRRTKKSTIVRSRRNPLIRNSSLGGYGYRKEEQSHAMELSLQTSHTVASRITGSGTGVGAFLKSIPGA